MVLEARFKRGLATPNRLNPLIPIKGGYASYHRCGYGKWHLPPLKGQGGDSIEGRVDAREFASLDETPMLQTSQKVMNNSWAFHGIKPWFN
jgi:hypothetical protein